MSLDYFSFCDITEYFQPAWRFPTAVGELSVHQLLVLQQRELRPHQEAAIEVRKAQHLQQGGDRRQGRVFRSIVSLRLERGRETEKEAGKGGIEGGRNCYVQGDVLDTSVARAKTITRLSCIFALDNI